MTNIRETGEKAFWDDVNVYNDGHSVIQKSCVAPDINWGIISIDMKSQRRLRDTQKSRR